MFYRNEDKYIGAVVLEQSRGVLALGEGGDDWAAHDEAWGVWSDYMMQLDSVGDLSGYIV